MFQPRTSDAPQRILAAAVFSSSEPFAAILYNLSNSPTLKKQKDSKSRQEHRGASSREGKTHIKQTQIKIWTISQSG
jgi:hypothetical protein